MFWIVVVIAVTLAFCLAVYYEFTHSPNDKNF